MKPLTIDELKALPIRDWVYVIVTEKDSIGNYLGECYYRKENAYGHENDEFFCGCRGYGTAFRYSDYGTKWLAYKNKEQAESKGEWVEFPYEIGSKVYCVRRNRNFKLVVSRTQVKMYIKHSRLLVKCACDSEWHELGDIFIDKSEAEARLKELRGEK